MSNQQDLFGRARYPEVPAASKDDTSRAAAQKVIDRALALRGKVYEFLQINGGHTVHETALQLGASVPSIQPRFSELRRQSMIFDSGERRVNEASGHKAIVWQAVKFPSGV